MYYINKREEFDKVFSKALEKENIYKYQFAEEVLLISRYTLCKKLNGERFFSKLEAKVIKDKLGIDVSEYSSIKYSKRKSSQPS